MNPYKQGFEMSAVPVSLLNLFSSTASVGIPEAQRDTADGFQSLLDIGVDARGNESSRHQSSSRRQDDKENLVAAYVEAPRASVADVRVDNALEQPKEIATQRQTENTTPETNQEKVREQVTRGENDRRSLKADESARPVSENLEEKNTPQSGGIVSSEQVRVATVTGSTQASDPAAPQPLYDRITAVLAFLSAVLSPETAENGVIEEQAPSLQNLRSLQQKLETLPPELLAKLQALVEGLETVIESDVPLNQLSRAGLPSLFGQLTAALAKPDAPRQVESVDALIAKLQRLVNTFQPTVSSDEAVPGVTSGSVTASEALSAPKLVQADVLAKQAQSDVQIKAAEQAATETTPASLQNIVQKPEAAPNAQANAQAVVRAENSASNTSPDTGGRGGDTAQGFTFSPSRPQAPTQPSTLSNVNFSQLLQRATPQPVLDQVVFHIKNIATTGVSKIHIQLNPAELGKLDIRMDVDSEGKTGITVTADNKSTLDLLQRDARGLERALADAGLKADSGSLSFNLRGDQGQDNQNQKQAANNYRQAMPEDEPVVLDAITRSYVVNLAEGLDIKI